MVIQYTNRRQQTFYLHQGTTSKGKPRYYFSQKPADNLPETIPDGYEIYEHPNAQVFLRKILPQLITPEEIALIKQGIEKYSSMQEKQAFLVDVKKEHLIIYLRDQDIEKMTDELSQISPLSRESLVEVLLKQVTYSPMMRLTLEDVQDRTFLLERWCFRGSIDDWISLDQSNDLQDLAQQYFCHLGKETFFELFYQGKY